MHNKLFVGNLPYSLSDQQLSGLFQEYGEIVSCTIAKDRDSGRPRGFGFVEMQSEEQAEAAIEGLNGKQVSGRQIAVTISQPKASSSSGRPERKQYGS